VLFDQSSQLKEDKENNSWYETPTNMKDISQEPVEKSKGCQWNRERSF